MTSKSTREERVQSLYDLKIGQVLNQSDIESIKMLARMALAAMDSEPVGYFGRFDPDDEDLIDQCSKNVKGAFPLYRHAQQPVVPDRSIFEKWWESQNGAPLDGWDSLRTTDGYCDGGIDGQFEAWNAAMLAAAPQEVPDGK
ncbi:hypothetical protein ACPEGK_19395 [Klebsiella sp. K794]|uniref:hypothetical protein n=1 Tax=Klebsiella sp. K794 TaxID=3369402 RepID=UPI003C2AE8F4